MFIVTLVDMLLRASSYVNEEYIVYKEIIRMKASDGIRSSNLLSCVFGIYFMIVLKWEFEKITYFRNIYGI